MKTKIKQWGDSAVIILNKEFMDFKKLTVGDWVDIDSIKRIEQKRDIIINSEAKNEKNN